MLVNYSGEGSLSTELTLRCTNGSLRSGRRCQRGSATAKALGYSLKRRLTLTRYIDCTDLAADNDRVENQIPSIALGRSN
ncbi:hypothetical protein EJP69_14800 [Variovorax gossypii]|uniref:Transposase IS66 central domain-containing protein n=1 Tax=Variovorax gossypii TaxID=1679495 RepID=A0A3S0GXR4_9BURK|nr:hypothetical protein [Variovorax paradoxus]RTQ35611.1 hypothetical protein EJP69_14800 [Variovorax gossypii]